MAEQLGSLDVAALTDIGLKRQRNEDFCEYRIPAPNTPQHAHGALFIVADGMGGMGGGDVASQTAVKTLFAEYYGTERTPGSTSISMIKSALNAANAAVRERAAQVNLPRIGSTLSGLLLTPDGDALIFNVGDARVYRIRQNFIEQLSHDQSVLQHQIDAGVISEEQARGARNVNVTAFVGQEAPLEAVYRRAQVQLDDIFLLCSDGLWDLVEPHEMLTIVQKYSAASAARRLIELAHKRGAHDNVTVIVLRIGSKPRRSVSWRGIVLALVLLAVIAAGAWFAFVRGEDKDDSAARVASTPTIAAAVASETPTARATRTLDASATAIHTAESAVIIYTATASNTPTATPTLDVTLTPLPTDTLTPSHTPTATSTPTTTTTPTRTNTPTRTPQPSDTPPPTATATRTPSPSPSATRTSRPSLTPTPTITPLPSLTTTPRPPTATLDPSVISPTPSPLPSATPTLTPGEVQLVIAAEDGVTLPEPATLVILYQFSGTDEFTVLKDVTLEAGTQVRLISETPRSHPDDAALLLREVEVLNTENVALTGWLDATVIEDAAPLVPYMMAHDTGANIRRGDNVAYVITGFLHPGELARITGKSTRANGWYQVEKLTGQIGWVSTAAADIIGDVADVPPATAPPLPTVAPPTQEPASEDGVPDEDGESAPAEGAE